MMIDPGLLDTWRGQIRHYRRVHAPAHAAVLEMVIEMVEESAREYDDAVLNLQEASDESGYTRDHLGRLVREGKIPNAGRPNAPQIRRADLPQKSGALRGDTPALQLVGAQAGQIADAIVAEGLEAHDG